ncbi:hypothetical protein EXE59_03960 [Nocardioides eburneiflavus]|uniref:Uncharacterized protein n=1 Tax=Nocardioides eburneiflavus TaxID=2518372 RepID=A0A4Z1CCC4_9ACTN|nr:hypothetical protein [Nocardioides eburneiflavus]TGN63195.1 hypothetical protein EXE59_03960 [Nocardioides eburneiflavus]
MSLERDRGLLEQVVNDAVGGAAQVKWETPERSWSAQVRLRGATGLVSHLLTSPEWQEARFEEPRCSVFITTTTDEDDVRDSLAKLARAAVEYLAGGGRVEKSRGLFGTRPVLVLRTDDGEWRIGNQSARHPV